MELTQLRYFRAIAQAGSMTAASRTLLVSQPTLSVAVQKLEDELDTSLFLRDRRGVKLTSTGRELLGHVEQVFVLLDEARERIAGLESEEMGRFVLGCPEALGAYFLPDVMAGFMQRYPRIELSLWNGASRPVQQAVLEREVHFGLVVNPIPHPDLVLVELFDDATDLFVAVDDDARSSRERLRAGPLIYVGQLPQSQELLKRLAEADLLADQRLECGDLELVKSLTVGRVGVGMLPRRVAAYGQEGRLRRLGSGLPHVADTIMLIYRADLHRTRAALTLKDALVDGGRALGPP